MRVKCDFTAHASVGMTDTVRMFAESSSGAQRQMNVHHFYCLHWDAGGAANLRHPPTKASFYSARRGKFSPDVTSNTRKAAGIEGGIRPIFGVTPRPASSWHLSTFLLSEELF